MTESKEKSLVRVLIADNNKTMRDTIIELIGSEFEIVGVAADGAALVELEEKLSPAIGILDISMPVMSGIEAARILRSRGSQMHIVFLTVYEDADFVKAAFANGATGYVVKRQMASELRTALNESLAGRKFVSPSLKRPGKNS